LGDLLGLGFNDFITDRPPFLMSRVSTFSPQLEQVAHSPSLSQLCLSPLSLGIFRFHPPHTPKAKGRALARMGFDYRPR
jgi:hypothetical protein